MRNILFFLLLIVGLTSFTQAQITVDKNDMPSVGDTIRLSVAPIVSSIDHTLTGPNYTWDYSSLQWLTQRLDSFVSPPLTFVVAGLPFNVRLAKFNETPDSIPLAGVSLDGGFDFFRNATSGYEGHGRGLMVFGFVPVGIIADPEDQIYNFPLNYADEDSSNSVATFDQTIPNLGDVFIRQERKRVNEVDGWGKLKTPFGEFDVLRVKSLVIGKDSFSLGTTPISLPSSTSTEYKWLGKGKDIPLLQINTRVLLGNEVITSIVYQDSFRQRSNPTAIDDNMQQLTAEVFPNPAKDFIQIKFPHSSLSLTIIELFDIESRRVYLQTTQTQAHKISVAELARGRYFLRISQGQKQFVKQVVLE